MAMTTPRLTIAGIATALSVPGLLALFAAFVPATMVNHHFFADDWALLAYANGFSVPIAIIEFARNLLRPVEGAFWIVELKLLGFDRSLVHFVSLLLNVGACGLFWHVLRRAYPEPATVAPAAALIAFFLPMLSTTTFIMYVDNSRLSVLLHWAGVAVCQIWALRPDRRAYLVLGSALFLASTLTYENTVLLIATVPMFVLPLIIESSTKTGLDRRRLALALGSILVVIILGFLAVRYFVLGGGVHRIAYPWPSATAFADYIRIAVDYLVLAIQEHPERPVDWVVGLVVGVVALWILRLHAKTGAVDAEDPKLSWLRSRIAIAATGAAVTVFGFAPYMLALSPPLVANLEGGGRFYSSAAYGIALLLALVATPGSPGRRRIGATVLAAYVGVNAAFTASLASRWAEAADTNCRIWRSLLAEALAVSDGTTFLFAAAEASHRGATVIGEPAGTPFLVSFLYGHRRWEDLGKVAGYHLAAFERELPPTSDRRLTVKADGLMVRGRNPTQPIDPNRVILVRRDGDRMIVLDRVTPDDRLISANWLDGIAEVRTNRNLILPAPPNGPSIEDRLAALSINCR